MTGLELHSTPRSSAVFVEQVRAVRLAVRREASIVTALVAAPILVVLAHGLSTGTPLSLDGPADMAGIRVLAGAVGLLAPFSVWKGEQTFGASPLWLLPVGHRRAALLKAAGGWAWLMIAVAALLLFVVLAALATGGAVGVDEMRLVLDPSEPSGAREVRWTTPGWTWLTPFAGGTVAYLFGSALLLATGHPGRWVAGVGLAVLALGVLGAEGEVAWLNAVVEELAWTLLFGPHGLDSLLTGGSVDGFTTLLARPDGSTEVAWRLLPAFGRWSTTTLVWAGAGAAALFAAASRHREGGRRRLRRPGRGGHRAEPEGHRPAPPSG